MKFDKRNDAIVNGVRPGFSDRDSHFLNKIINLPKTQIWSAEDLEDEIEPEDKIYYCAMCKSKLDYVKYLDAYRCDLCIEYYDTNIQDTPLKDIKDFQLAPYGEQRHYPQFDENDLMTPFVESIPVDKLDEEDYGVEIRTYDNGRIQHINLHNVTFADALAKANVLSARKDRNDEFDS